MSKYLDINDYSRIIVLTGAGISVASGLKTYRGPTGIWTDADIDTFATKEALEDNPHRVWRFFAQLRKQLITTEPNATHYALARFEKNLKDNQSFTLITQNV